MPADAIPPPGVNPGAAGQDPATVAARTRRVAYLTDAGLDQLRIAAELGVTTRTVSNHRRRARGGPAPPTMTPELTARAVELYAGGLTAEEAGAELGVSRDAVRRALTAAGVQMRPAARRPSRAPCGTRARYLRGCTCKPCSDAAREYKRAWRARRREAGGS